LQAVPDAGWSFSSWSGNLTGNVNPSSITMSGNMNVTANFTQVNYTLSLTKVGNGSVTVNGTSHTLPWSGTFPSGSVVQLQAVPDSGWGFSSWSGDLTGNANPSSITMSGNKNVTVTFNQSGWLTGDDDGDGLLNGVEQNILHTDPNKKTLFVRPTMADYDDINGVFKNAQYWPDFVQVLFPKNPSNRAIGYADIPAFTNAQIEIIVIGDDNAGHPYTPMRSYNYTPSASEKSQGVTPDILEVVYVTNLNDSLYNSLCTAPQCSNNYGHTYFKTSELTWYWDTKGYTPGGTTPSYNQYRYFTPQIYPFAIDNYRTEGAYVSIKDGAPAPVTTNCTAALCGSATNHCSPMNLNDGQTSEPYTIPPDGTVELYTSNHLITFLSGGAIDVVNVVGNVGPHYDRNQVLRRVVAHEMGHALAATTGTTQVIDHCDNNQCVMHMHTLDYDNLNFGTTCGHYDLIRSRIHNRLP